jgi:hypothetical protein
VLGIAALLGATAAIVIAVLVSHGDGPRVAPLREETAKRENARDEGAGPRWLIDPHSRPHPRRTERRHKRRARDREQRTRRGGHRAAKPRGRKHELPRRVRVTNPGPLRGRAAPSSPLAVPAPSPSPSSPVAVPAPAPAPTLLTTPPAAIELAPAEESDIESSNTPETASTPEAHSIDIEIKDGELESQLDRVHPQDGRVRLRIRSDELVIVDVEDYEPSWSIAAGGEALIEFATDVTKGFKLKLRRRKGVLNLRLRD